MSDPLRLVWRGDQRYDAVDSYGRTISIDGDVSTAAGAKPSDLLPLSLAACVAYTLLDVLKKRRQTVEGLEATITARQEPEPPWMFTSIDCAFTLRGDVDVVKARKALEMAHAKYCSVSVSLRDEVEQRFSVTVE